MTQSSFREKNSPRSETVVFSCFPFPHFLASQTEHKKEREREREREREKKKKTHAHARNSKTRTITIITEADQIAKTKNKIITVQ